MRQQDRQTVGVILTLVGMQDTSTAAHQPGTDNAAVSVRIGKGLIYLHDAPTVAAFVSAWHDLSGEATKLPREPSRRHVAPIRGMKEPAVLIDAAGAPPVSGRLVRLAGQHSYLRLQIGRVVFDVRDIGAFASTMVAFREAGLLAKSAFPEAPAVVTPRQRALQDAAQVFRPPREAGRHGPRTRTRDGRTPAPVTPTRPGTPDLAAGWTP